MESLAIFGSVARDEATDDSDIDVLVDFGGRHSFADFMDLKLLLEDLLGRKVDPAEREALREELAPRILREAVLVARGWVGPGPRRPLTANS